MSKDVCIDETALGQQRRIKFKEDNDDRVFDIEERGKEEMIKLIQGISSLALMEALTTKSATTKTTKTTESTSSFDPSKILCL